MRSILIMVFSIIFFMNASSQSKITDRQPVAAGRFYPAEKEKLQNEISILFSHTSRPEAVKKVRALISPHAGYVFSGAIAASAFSIIPEHHIYKNIFIIGTSHTMSFDGASVYHTGNYLTPLGKATVNMEIASGLIKNNSVFKQPVTAHLDDHSIEVQVPLMQYYFKNLPPIVPIIIGTTNKNTIKEIAEALRPWFNEENLFVISSDFSHYPQYNDAVEIDMKTSESILSGDPGKFLGALKTNSSRGIKGLATSMCGWTSGLALMYLAEGDDRLEFIHVNYANSGDSPYGGKNEVVGYHAIALTEKETSELSFSEQEKSELFLIARNSIQAKLENKKDPGPDSRSLTSCMYQQYGAFVTLKMNGVLRGCIGCFTSSKPLYEVVREAAVSSAFGDPRFMPLTKEEYRRVDIEITVLGPLKKINDISEIILGKHGIYIKKELRSGTMLPQVATENGWTLEEFLGYTSRDKTGIGWDGWKNAELFIYEGAVLAEK
jgi:MEMO1 family protein